MQHVLVIDLHCPYQRIWIKNLFALRKITYRTRQRVWVQDVVDINLSQNQLLSTGSDSSLVGKTLLIEIITTYIYYVLLGRYWPKYLIVLLFSSLGSHGVDLIFSLHYYISMRLGFLCY